jgi:hypothetical protein
MTATNTSNDLVPRSGTFPMPGMDGEAAPRKVKVNSQAVVLVIVLGVSAAALASMRHIGMKSGMTLNTGANASVMQTSSVQDDPEKVARYDRIMKDLQQLQQPLDIALGDLARIPDLIPSDRKVQQPQPGMAAAPTPDDPNRENQRRLADMRAKASQLKLQSCMGGKVPLARIDGKFYRLGDLVNETFIVKTIEHRSVTVEAGGEQFVLEMQAGKPASTSKKR